MKFGNLFWQQSPDFSYPIPQRIREGIDLAVECEALGFDQLWFAEQHFHNYGYSPNPLMLAEAVAMRTKTIRLGMSILVLPLWNPVRLAEDTAMLDILSDGRLDVGIGRGYQHLAFRGFDVDIEQRQIRFEECLEVLLQSWTSDELVFKGEIFDFSAGVNVLPKPVQSPHPPVWMAVTSDDNVRYVAKTDFRVFGSANFANTGQARRDYELYLSERQAAGLPGDHWSYALNRQMYVIPKGANWKAEKESFEARCRYTIRSARGLRADNAKYTKGVVDAGPMAVEETTDELFDRVLFGYAEEVAEHILRLNEVLPIDMLIVQNDFGGLPHAQSRLSQELFGTDVIPILQRETASVASRV